MISFSLFDRVKFIILLLPERWRTLSSSLLFDTNTILKNPRIDFGEPHIQLD